MKKNISNNFLLCLLSVLVSNIAIAATDLAVSITAATTDTFVPGTSHMNDFVFTVTKTDSMEADVTNIPVTASFNSAGLSGMTWTCSASGTSSCGNSSGNGAINTTVDIGTGTVTYTFTNVTVSPNIFANMNFDVAVTSPGDGNNGNNTATKNITRASITDINISVSDSSNTYTPGNTGVDYTINVSNAGPSNAQGIAFSDTVPAGMVITSWTCTVVSNSSCSSNGASNNNVNPSLDIDFGGSVEIVVTADYLSSSNSDPLFYEVTALDADLFASDPTPATATDSDARDPISNISISVDTSVPSVMTYTPGLTGIYKVIVSNSGPSDVSGVTVVDNNLTNFSAFSWTCMADPGSSCGAASGSGRLNTTANVDSGDDVTYTVTVTYDSSSTTSPLVYTVDATNPAGVTPTVTESDSKSLTRNAISNLTVTLTDSATAYTPGLSGTFTATVTNTGPSDVDGVTVVDNNTSDFASIAWTCSVTLANSACTSATGSTAINTTVDLAAGDSAIFMITAGYDSATVTNPLVYTVTATNPMGVNGTSPATGTDNNDVLDRHVDLTITKTGKLTQAGGDATLVPNEPFIYSIVISNAGPSDLGAGFTVDQNGLIIPTEQGVRLVDTFDTTLVEYSDPMVCDSGGLNKPCWKYCTSDGGDNGVDVSPDLCPDGEIGSDAGASMDIPVRIASGSSSEIRVYTRTTNSTGSDCDIGTMLIDNEVCNTATISIVETATTQNDGITPLTDSTSNEIVIGTDIIVSKTDNKISAAPGTPNTYTVTVRNDGFINVQGISVVDIIPLYPANSAGFVPGSISSVCETSDIGACCNSQSTLCGLNSPISNPPNNELHAVIDLDSQSELTFTITGDIHSQATGTLTNSATATILPNALPADVIDIEPSNDTDIDTTSLGDISDITVTKSVTATQNSMDNTVTDLQYIITVQNLGPSVASTVNVVDALNSTNLDINTVSLSCSVSGGGSCSANTGMALNTPVSLNVNSIATFIINISTNSGAQGQVVNVATATTTGFDPVSINNSDSVEYSLTGTAQLTISNDDAKLNATPGLDTNYTIRVTNEGPDGVFGATVINEFPPQLTDVEWTCSAVSPVPGDLTLFQRSDQSAAGTHMVMSPDDSHVYITSPDPTGVASKLYVFKRNTVIGSNFGEISFVEFITQGEGGVDGLETPVAMSMSQSGQHLYVLSNIVSGSANVPAISIFSRNSTAASPDFGKLTYQGIMSGNIPADPLAMLLSSDQKHIYVTGNGNIQRYARDIGTGLLTHEDTATHADAGVLAQSASGDQIYVIDATGNDVIAYSRETDSLLPAFGDLTSLNTVTNSDIDDVSDVVVSQDGLNLYLTASGTNKLVVIDRNISTGMITFQVGYNNAGLLLTNNVETLVGLSSVSISQDGEHVFVGNPADTSVLVLGRNSQGLLSKKERIAIPGLEGINDIAVTLDGKHVMTTASGIGGKTLTAFDRRQPDPVFSFIEAEYNGVNDPRDIGGTVGGLLGASAVVVSDDGNNVYVTGLGDNSVSVFARDKTKGSTSATHGEHLIFLASYIDGDSGITNMLDVNSLAITPNGDYLYVGSSDNATLTVFARASNGLLSYVTSYQHASNSIDGLLGISGMTIDPSSQDLYVAGKFEASVAHYSINQTSGLLTLVDSVANGDAGVSGLAGARSLVISPDGEHVMVAASIDDSIVVLTRDPANGEITFMQRVSGVGDQPMDITVSPDGEHVYVVSANDNKLTVLRRVSNPSSATFGRLASITAYIDEVNGFNYLQGARSVAISSDGKKVYVGSEFDHAISVMDRDQNPNSTTFGQLAVIEVRIDDVDGVDGLNQLYELVVSKDSRHVYAAGFSDNALSAYVLGAGSACSAQGSGNINDSVDIGSNGTLTYSVSAKIRSNALGFLVTEASIIPPPNFTIVTPVDNCSTSSIRMDDNCDRDSTTLVPVTDLSITKTDNRLSVIAGEPTQYEIVVSNNGPSDATSSTSETVTVTDVLGSQFDSGSVNWTCEATGSGSLEFIQSVKNNSNNIVGLEGVSALAMSPNLANLGAHVLAVSVLENGLLAFSIDPVTGELTQVLQSMDFVQATAGINLTGARDVLIIDDDIYVTSQVDDSLVVFKAVDNSGLELQWQANHNFTSSGFGLNQAVAVVASEDGKNIYVAGANDNSVVVFSRDLMSGALTYDSVITEGTGGSLGLSGINTLAISSDGYSVYTSGVNSGSLGHYKRELTDGSLSYVEIFDSNNTAVDMSGLSTIVVSDNGEQVYVTNSITHSIYVFSRKIDVLPSDSSYGQLSLQQQIVHGTDNVVGMLNPSDITISADKRHVYVTSEQSDTVLWFARNLLTGDLSFGGLTSDSISNVDGLDGAKAVIVDDSGNFVYVAGSIDNAIAVLSRTDDSFCPAGGTGDIGVNVDIAVNGSLVFQVNAIVAADAASVTNTLINEASVYSCTDPITLPLSTCTGIDPNTLNNVAIDSDSLNPTADLMITKTDGLSQYDGLLGALKITGDTDNVYVAAKGEDSIGIFARESNNSIQDFGQLTYLGNVKNGIDGVSGLLAVSDVLLSSDGETLYAAGSGDNSLVVFKRSLSDGSLTFLERHSSGVFGVVGIEGVKSLSLSDDGAHLYATGPLTNSLAVFAVDQNVGVSQGSLSFIQKLQNGVSGITGLASISDVAVSADNKHVYVTSSANDSISVFLRNPNSGSMSFGQLSYIATYVNGIDGIGGLGGATALTLSSTNGGEFVYVLGATDQSLALFSRDDQTGELTFVEFKQNGTSNVEGLDSALDLILSNDESSLYVAGSNENALVQFDRNPNDGILSFVEALHDGDALTQPGEFINGLNAVSGLYVSPDDNHIYVVATSDNSTAVFSRDSSGAPNLNGNLDFLQVLIDDQGGVAPGTEVTYSIVVRNLGPSDVEKARVIDVFPADFEQISYQCFPLDGAACDTNVQIGNVNEVVNLPVGSRVEIRATGMIKSDATGTLSNTATVASSTDPAFAISDPDITNNTATDADTLLSPAVNIIVTKENALTEVIPGTPVNYTIVVANDAALQGNNIPSDISSVIVTDMVPEAISNVNWSCEAFPQPGLLDDGDGDDLVNNFIYYNDLEIHNDMVINQAGSHAYVTGISSGVSTLLVYERNKRTGELTEIDRLSNGINSVSGLSGAQGLILSPDQNHLYVVSDTDDSIVTFTVDSSTSELTFVNVHIDGISGVNGIGGAKDIVISNDGKHIYVAGKLDNAIALFSRNSSTGELTYNTLVTGVEGLSGIESMVFNATNNYLIVVAESNNSIASFQRNISSGILTPINVLQDFELNGSVLEQPRDVAILNNDVYVASFASDAVSVFNLDSMTGMLTFDYAIHHSDTDVTMMEGPESLIFSNNGKELYVASSVSDSVTLFAIDNNLLSPLNIVFDSTLIPELDGVNQLTLDPKGDYFYALSDDLVMTIILNGSTCSSTGTGHLTDTASISSGGHVTYSLQGDVIHSAIGNLSNSATALPGMGFVELFSPDNTATDTDVLTPISDLSVSKTDNKLEVVAGTPSSYQVDAFSAGPSTVNARISDPVPIFPSANAGFFKDSITWQCSTNKTLQLNAEYVDDSMNGLIDVSDVVYGYNNQYVYTTSPTDGSVTIFSNDISGQLSFIALIKEGDDLPGGTVTGLAGASSLTLDQSGNYLYVTGETSNSIVVFTIDSMTGLIDYKQTVTSGIDSVVGLTGPVEIEISTDNTGLYVAAKGSQAITVFSRNVSTGELTFIERVKDGLGTILPNSNVIIGISDLILSSDGKYLYTASDFSDTIAIFSRDENTQILTFIEVIREGDNHGGLLVDGMDGIQSIVMSPNGNFLYAVATLDSSILTFTRNASNGLLQFDNAIHNGDLNSGNIQTPTSIDITPDGGRLLVADSDSDTINLYDRDTNSGNLDLIDIFTNIDHGSTLLSQPKTMANDGTNIIIVSQDSNALVALRITAHAECQEGLASNDIAVANLFMAPGSSGGIVVQGLVHPSARGVINNIVSISPILGSDDDNLANNTSLDLTQITIETDVSIVKTGSTDVVAGESISYSLLLTNMGPSDALDANIIDIFDPAVINASWTCSATGRSLCNDSSGTGSIDTIVNIGIDGQILINISATVSSDFFGSLENTANVVVFEEGFNTDTDLSNNSSTISTNVTMVADVEISKTNNIDEVVAGEIVTYDIVVVNNGPSDAPDNLVIDNLPNVYSNIIWTCTTDVFSSCSASGTGNIQDMVYIAANSQLNYQIQAMLDPSATGEVTNFVSIDVLAPATDPDTSNNNAEDTDVITQVSDMTVALSSSLNPYDPDSLLDLPFMMNVINLGPSDSKNVTVSFTMDTNLKLQVNSACSFEVPFVICDIGDSNAGENHLIPIELRLFDEITPSLKTSVADVVSTTFDPDLDNNFVTLETDLITGIDVRVTKTDGFDLVEPDAILKYLITIDNIGSIDSGDMVIVEQLPIELISATWECTAYGDAMCLNIDEMLLLGGANVPAGSKVEFVLTALVDPALQSSVGMTFTNTVSAQLTTETDYNLLNNTATDTNELVLYIFKNGFEVIVP